MQGCAEAKKAIDGTEKEIRKKVDCQVAQIDLVLTRKEFEVMCYFVCVRFLNLSLSDINICFNVRL